MKNFQKSSVRIWVSALVVLFAISVAGAAENPLKLPWSLGKSKPTTHKPASGSIFGLPSPSRMFDKVGKQTDSMLKKTRKGWRGAQNFGKSLNPFTSSKTKKKSFLDTVFPKQPVESGPATMGEFLEMKRPGF